MKTTLLRGVALGVVAGLLAVACQAAAPPTPSPAPPTTLSLFLSGDTVLGPHNLTEDERAAGTVCVQRNLFAKNEQIVWRMRVVDPTTGQPMDDQALGSVVVRLPDQELPMRYGPHPRDNPLDYFWTASFDVPESYPSGALAYTVVATATDGRTGTYNQFPIAPAQLKVTEDVRPIIAPTPSP